MGEKKLITSRLMQLVVAASLLKISPWVSLKSGNVKEAQSTQNHCEHVAVIDRINIDLERNHAIFCKKKNIAFLFR